MNNGVSLNDLSSPEDKPGVGKQRIGEAEFAAAVRDALKNYHRPARLRKNPLCCSRLVLATRETATPPPAAAQALQRVLRAQCDALGEAPKLAALKRVLELTYFKPTRCQQTAADALHLSWSTYRRRLTSGVRTLAAQLWEAETALACGATAPGGIAVERRSYDRRRNSSPPTSVAPKKHGGRPAMRILAIVVVAVVCAALWLLPPFNDDGSNATSLHPPALRGELVLAVLPFLNINHDRTVRQLSDGLTVELINRLGRASNIHVVARTSSFAFRGKPVDVREIGRVLGADSVLEGSIQSKAGKARIRIALVNARTGYERWSREYSVGSRNLLHAEDAIAKAIINQLHRELHKLRLGERHARPTGDR